MLKKYIILFILSASISFAAPLKIKGAKVYLEINGKNYWLNKGTEVDIPPGITVRFLAGTGRIVINNVQIRKKSKKKSYTVPFNKKDTTISNSLLIAMNDALSTISNAHIKRHAMAKPSARPCKKCTKRKPSKKYPHKFIETDDKVLVTTSYAMLHPVEAYMENPNGFEYPFKSHPITAYVRTSDGQEYQLINKNKEETRFSFDKKNLGNVVIKNAQGNKICSFRVRRGSVTRHWQ